MKKIFLYISFARFLLCWFYLKCSSSNLRLLIYEDFARWMQVLRQKQPSKIYFSDFVELLTHYPEFRNLVYARLNTEKKGAIRILSLFASPLPLLTINPKKCGGGMFIQHGFATIIAPRKIGKNCWVNQGVTIGYTNDNDCPIIGDNVKIFAGAKVLGNVHVGDNSVIAANAVVVKDVPSNVVVGGVPAKIIKHI